MICLHSYKKRTELSNFRDFDNSTCLVCCFRRKSAASLSRDLRHLLNVAVSRARVGGSVFGVLVHDSLSHNF